MKTDQPLFLNEEQVREHLRMTELIPAMEKALIDFSAGRVTQPVRSIISIDSPGTDSLGLMPALTPDGLGLKAVTFYPSNAATRNPDTHGDDFSCRSTNGNATRDNGRAVNHRDENRRRICSGDETARIA